MSNKLPPKMRAKRTSSGKVYYYYDTCQNPRKWIALGSVFADAAIKYAELEYNTATPEIITFKHVSDRYLIEIIPTKAPRTQNDNLKELEWLLKFFNDPPAPIDEIEPIHVRKYLDWRSSSPIRANREKALLSHIFNKAREWGYTKNTNPCAGVKGYKEIGRDIYVTDEEYYSLYKVSARPLRDAMDLLYLTGQRPADVLKMDAEHIIDGELYVTQNKRGQKLRFIIQGELDALISRLPKSGALLRDDRGNRLSATTLRSLFNTARKISGASFQLRDLRAKAGTDKENNQGMAAAKDQLGHKSESMTAHYVRHRIGKKVTPTK